MNPEDFVDYTGYDSPDYDKYSDEETESDTSGDEEPAEGENEELGDIEGEWVGDERGREKVIFRSSLYTINSTSANGEFLFARCDRRNGCTSRLWIRAADRRLHLLKGGEHNHEVNPVRASNARVKNAQMQLIEADPNLEATVVVERTTENLTSTEKLFLPQKDSQVRAVEARKRRLLGLPP